MNKVMDRVRAFVKKNPIIAGVVGMILIAAAGYQVARAAFGGRAPAPPAAVSPSTPPTAARPATPPAATPTPTPTPVASPAPGTKPAPAPAVTPAPTVIVPPAPGSKVPPGPVGRDDPFVPLVRPTGPSTAPPPPPSVGLPPPPFPTPGGVPLPPPPLPGGGIAPLPVGPEGIVITGIVGNSHAVAIIVIGGRTAIVGAGDELGDLRVVRVDAVRRLVAFSRAGRRFDVRMGGE